MGYWENFGFDKSEVDWCEQNYQVTEYIAEFCNTISSFVMVLWGAIGLYYHYGLEFRIKMLFSFLSIVGLGSAAFHGTLLFHSQMLDELPMIYSAIASIYVLYENKLPQPFEKQFPWLLAITAITVSIATAYSSGSFQCFAFRVSFAILNLIVFHRFIRIARKDFNDPIFILLWNRGILAYGIAFLAWVVDVKYCSWLEHQLLFNPQLHAWWHILATVGTYYFTLFITYYRYKSLKLDPCLGYSFLNLPYIYVKEGK